MNDSRSTITLILVGVILGQVIGLTLRFVDVGHDLVEIRKFLSHSEVCQK